ncbi:hypothetical protein QTO34_016897 [Cnephaeus nilssonii]|uniref:Uncharacterized protein n=1 Tax=Cnephaeus nilssonii TaxID=3371016 RepID=A0AA40I441_CNENI|nr:hypothetical protein QTO34_016897 [Eptesicus nilssonii]
MKAAVKKLEERGTEPLPISTQEWWLKFIPGFITHWKGLHTCTVDTTLRSPTNSHSRPLHGSKPHTVPAMGAPNQSPSGEARAAAAALTSHEPCIWQPPQGSDLRDGAETGSPTSPEGSRIARGRFPGECAGMRGHDSGVKQALLLCGPSSQAAPRGEQWPVAFPP